MRISWKFLSMTAGAAVLVLGIVLGIRLIPYLPPPAGQFPVGTASWDIDRSDMEAFQSAWQGCRLSTRFWYPAEPGAGDGRAPYAPSGAGLLSGARWARTGATWNPPLSSRRVRYPVLLSLPGWAGALGENTAFMQDLASRGFIVVGIGYNDPACAGADAAAGDFAAPVTDFSSRAAFEHTLAIANQKIERVAGAASHVVDALEALDRVDPGGRFGGRLDLDRVGVVGYSLGGAIALQLCWRDNRVKGAVNIDGWLFDAAPGGIKQPFMYISDDDPPVSADPSDPSAARRYQSILDEEHDRRMADDFAKHGDVTVTVLGSKHSDFSDTAYLSRLALLERRRPDGAAIRTAADYSAAFFGQVLNGEASPLFSKPAPSVRLKIWDRSPVVEGAK